MKKLLSFEFFKRWRSYRVGLAVAAALQIILIPLLAVLQYLKAGEVPLSIVGCLYSVIILTILFIPPIESISRFRRDIFGNVAVLELSLPQPAWKKMLSKLIVTFCTMLAALLLCIASFVILSALTTETTKFTKGILMIFNTIGAHSSLAATITSFIILNCVAAFCIIMFTLTLSRAITHRIKIAGWISAGVFVVLLTAYIIFHVQIYMSFGVVPTILYLAAISVILFLVTSWLLENRVEV